jgi:hypothetical protein
MATWQNVMTTMVRHLINDLGATEVFEDSRIQQAIILAGIMASQEYDFSEDYSFDFEGLDITPDPVAEEDNAAIALITLKTACIMNLNQFQSAVKTGIKVRDGDSQVDTTGSFGGYSDILKYGPCTAYKNLLDQTSISLSMGRGKAVFSPYSDDVGSTWGVRGNYGNWSNELFFNSLGGY